MSVGTAATTTGYNVRLRRRREVARRTLALEFEKPAGFAFKAGQSIDVQLIDPPETDALGTVRPLSIASAPQEDSLMVATRLRDSAFKRTLAALAPGAFVHIEGPFGDMVLHNNPRRPAVLLAGGIGITPFRSMVVRAAKEKLPHRIFLFFSNRSPEDAPFLDDLRALESENPNYRFIPTMTGTEGHLVAATLTRHLAGIDSPLYYLAGPAAMVGGMRALLNTSGVDDDDIRAEEFSGY